jgi:hypothetical protein
VHAVTFAFREEFNFLRQSHPDLVPNLDPDPHPVHKSINRIPINMGSPVNADDFAFGRQFCLSKYGIRIRIDFWIPNQKLGLNVIN